jgi:hypothetical protein
MDSATWGLSGLPVGADNVDDLLMPRPPEYQWFWGPHKNRAPLSAPRMAALVNAASAS